MPDALETLQDRLGYRFDDRALLEQALTHRSANRRVNNERLEFLGDAHLGQVISNYLFRNFPEASEGQLTRMRAMLVRGQTLADVARELAVGDHLVLGGGEMKSGGSRRDSILADALEALIGAMVLDGGEQTCKSVVLQWFESRLAEMSPAAVRKDAKTRLQEWLQGRQHPLPEYEVLEIRGQAPNQEFDVVCRLTTLAAEFQATAASRRKAEQGAAGAALRWLESNGEQGA